MPIAECGFPQVVSVAQPAGGVVVRGDEMLVDKGPTVHVTIGFDGELFDLNQAIADAAMQRLHQAAPAAQFLEALIDTGACESCIDEDLAKALQLPLVDQVDAAGVGGWHKLNVYLGYVRVVPLNYAQVGRFIGAKLSQGGQPHQALLGRSLLKSMLLVYDGRHGTVRLCY